MQEEISVKIIKSTRTTAAALSEVTSNADSFASETTMKKLCNKNKVCLVLFYLMKILLLLSMCHLRGSRKNN